MCVPLLHLLNFLRLDGVSEANTDEKVEDGLENEESDGIDAISDGSTVGDVNEPRGLVKLMEKVSIRIFPPFVGHVDVQVVSIVHQRSEGSAH